jgi:hypothetical protein
MTAEDEKIIGQFLILYPLIGTILLLGVFEVIKENWRTIIRFFAIPVAAWKRNRERRRMKRKPVNDPLMKSEDIVNNFIRRRKAEQRDARKP